MHSLNKAYRLVWNDATQAWQVTHELARGKGKGSKAVRIAPVAVACFGLLACGSSFAEAVLLSSRLVGNALQAATGTTNVQIGNSSTLYSAGSVGAVVIGDDATSCELG